MKRNAFALLRTFMFVALMPALALSLVSCDPESDVTPEVSVPEGYEDYFTEDLSFSCLGGEAKVAFQINVAWSMEVVGGSDWLSVEPASGDAGLQEVVVRVTDNDTYEPRSAKIQLMVGTSKVAEISVIQDAQSRYEAVDLGLSVKWASCNVGAESPEDYGGYYAWGETEEKSNYEWSTYKWYNGSYDTMTKYCTDSSYGTVDNKTILDPEDDVAHVEWGGSWRMPTLDEIKELGKKCTWEWTTVNGVTGYKVTGPNGNSIFLPAAGDRRGTEVIYRGSRGYYWSGTLYESNSGGAYFLAFDVGGHGWNYYYRIYGRPVRPVTD